MAGNATESGRSVTSKVASILLTFIGSREHSLTEVACWARLPVSTTHRLLAEMTSWQLLERTPRGLYRAALPFRMISGAPSAYPGLEERAPCVLEDLVVATRYRARLGVLHELDITYIEKRPGHQPTTAFNRAARLPAHPTALGRALLAFSPPTTVDMVITRGLRPYTRAAVTRDELEPQTCTVAMPVFGPGEGAVAAIELTVPNLGDTTLRAALAGLTIATRSLARELTGADRLTRTTGPPSAAATTLAAAGA